MSDVNIGSKSVCGSCGEDIVFIGPYWKHVHSSPRHPGAPSGIVVDELRDLRATVAALTAERDAAYRRGWDAAIEAALKITDSRDLGYTSELIRALQPPTAPTEHDAATLDTCGLCKNFKRCESLFGCKPDDEYCDWYPSRFERA